MQCKMSLQNRTILILIGTVFIRTVRRDDDYDPNVDDFVTSYYRRWYSCSISASIRSTVVSGGGAVLEEGGVSIIITGRSRGWFRNHYVWHHRWYQHQHQHQHQHRHWQERRRMLRQPLLYHLLI